MCAARASACQNALSFSVMRLPFAPSFALASIVAAIASMPVHAQLPAPRSADLHVYFVDVEGGQATLFVTPKGESLLIDTGWQEHGARDAERIVATAHRAGLSRIDNVLITHYHEDHVGGVPQLTARIPVGTFLDHGLLYEHDGAITEKGYNLYLQQIAAGKGKRLTLHPGDKLPLTSLDATVISSNGRVITHALPGAGQPNPLCADEPRPTEDLTENGHSLGILIHFAGVSILDLGDLTKDRERMLTCPDNLLGRIDIDIVSHHGWSQSSAASFIHAIQPRVAIMDNGATKGGSTPVLDVFHTSPHLEALWQLHTSEEGSAKSGSTEHNSPSAYIANTPGTDGNMLELAVHPDGSYDVRNDRTGEIRKYAARR